LYSYTFARDMGISASAMGANGPQGGQEHELHRWAKDPECLAGGADRGKGGTQLLPSQVGEQEEVGCSRRNG